MKTATRRRPSVLFQFSISYVCVMIVSLIMSVSMYLISYRNAENQAIQFSSVLLDQTCGLIEKSLSEADNFSNVLNNMSELAPLNRADIPRGELTMQIHDAAGSLPSFSDTSGLITRYFLYFEKSNVIVQHGSGYLNLRDYYQSSFSYGDLSFEEWSGDILHEKTGVLLPAKSNRFENIEYHSFLYIKPIITLSKNYAGRIFFFLDENTLFRMIASVYEYGVTGIAVYNEQNLLLASDGDTAFPEKALSTETVARSDHSIIISSPLSTRARIRLAICIPSSYFSARLRSLRTTLLIGMGSLLLVGVLLDFWLLRMSHRPLKKAIDTLRSFSLEAPSSLGQLEHSVRQLVFSNEALTQQVNHQKDELRRAAYQLLMNRDMHTDQDVEALLSYVGVSFSGNYFRGVYLLLGNEEEGSFSNGSELGRSIILKILEEASDRLLYLQMQDSNYFALLLIAQDDSRESISDLFENLYKAISGVYSAPFVFFVGPPCARLTDLSYSFDVAWQIAKTEETENRWLIIEDEVQKQRGYQYSVHTEQLLIRLAESGNAERTDELLDQIKADNFEKQQVIGMDRAFLLYRLADSAARIGGSEVPLSSEITHQLQHPDPDEFFAVLKKQYHQLCENANNKHEKHSDQLIQNILDYMETEYASSDISLTSVAMRFNITEKYLSSVFKTKVGLNFSQWVENRRIQRAEILLETTDQPIGDIAEQCGYISAKTFGRAFSRITGESPASYRKRTQMTLQTPE